VKQGLALSPFNRSRKENTSEVGGGGKIGRERAVWAREEKENARDLVK